MLRNTFLTLSHSNKLRRVATDFAPARRISRRFVAGEQLEEAIQVTRDLNQQGLIATLDYLGENTTNRAEADSYVREQLQALNQIAKASVKSNISLKLTALGLDISYDMALENMRRILERARQVGNFIRIDMESSDYVDRTLKIYETLREEGFDNVGVVIQSYLYRSERDVLRLVELGANVRLVKGAYDEPPHLAFPDKRDVDANFIHLMKLMLAESARKKGVFCAIASHDPRMIDATKQYASEQGIPIGEVEFQMLYGIATTMHHQLAGEGYRFRVYIPYGTHWYPYFMRRLAERPANVLFILKSLLRR